MDFQTLPQEPSEFMHLTWPELEPYGQELLDRPLDRSGLDAWLADWTRIKDLVEEMFARLKVAVDQDTADPGAEARFHTFLDTIYPAAQALDQQLKEKLLASGLEPENFANPLRRLRAEAALFRPENLSLLSEERKLASRYDKIIGAQTVTWQGQELTLQQLRPALLTDDRAVRREVWQRSAARQLADRGALNALWSEMMALRGRLAANAGQEDYRLFRWQQLLRLDYTPEDGAEFQAAIESVAVPAATRRYEKHRRRLGVDALRPWDLDADLYPLELPALPTYGNPQNLAQTAGQVFQRVDPQLGDYFAMMQAEGLLDLQNRKGKSPGAYSIGFLASRRPFIFMNAVGLASDVRTLLHEAGHAFHTFERITHLPYNQQRLSGLEFAEVASMAMELLASPYLSTEAGGYYTTADAARFRIAHLERILFFWPYMAVVDAFNNWVYTHHAAATDPAACDARWLELWERFLPGVDWTGFQDEAMTGWHRKQHIFRYPFYYLEYGLAQLGAVQIWQNALRDQPGAVRDYRKALALGGTVSLPELYAAAGAKFAFDAGTLARAVTLLEEQLERLEAGAQSF